MQFYFCERVLEGVHASFVETVPFKNIAAFTLFQFVYLLICFGITWIPIAGILFPVPFFLLISIREHLLPKLFQPQHLHELDAAEYEEIAGAPQRSHSFMVCYLVSVMMMMMMPMPLNWTSLNFVHIHMGVETCEQEIGGGAGSPATDDFFDAEVLDEMTTNRGELKFRTVSFNEDRLFQV